MTAKPSYRYELCVRILTGLENPAQVVAQTMQHYLSTAAQPIDDVGYLERDARRQQNATEPEEPANAEELVMLREWTMTGGVENAEFLQYDSGPHRAHRLLLFASEKQLHHLSLSREWFMGGTSKRVPEIFAQMYVIRSPLGKTFVTCCYVVMTGKSQSEYTELLKAVLQACGKYHFRPRPRRVVVDFEKGMMNAVETVLGSSVQVTGCFYHLAQFVWRKVQSIHGLANAYVTNKCIQTFISSITCLAFLPLDSVKEGMAILKRSVPKGDYASHLSDLLCYFDATYVNGSWTRTAQSSIGRLVLRRCQPDFPPPLWNLHKQCLSERSRTNNPCKGWFNAFRYACEDCPSFYHWIEAIRLDRVIAAVEISRAMGGLMPSGRKSAKAANSLRHARETCELLRGGLIGIQETLQSLARYRLLDNDT